MFILVIALVLLSMPAFADFRLDLGFDVPISLGGGGESIPFLPIPEVCLYYMWNVGPVNMGAGLRAFTFIIESAAWPNFIAEYTTGPVVFEAQLGGVFLVAFGAFGSTSTFGSVLIPDLSAWFKIGKTGAFRLGGGILGLYATSLSSSIGWQLYFGGKVALDL
jgi:hypothetical protein